MIAVPPDCLGILWGLAALVAAWVVVPPLFMMLGLTYVRYRILGGPEALEPTGDDPQYADLFETLRGLGFEPLGSRQEIGWFANNHWYRAYPPGRVFASPTGDCFVTLFRIFAGQPWRLSFHTVFTDGSLVSTANQMPHFRVNMPGYFRWGHVTPDLGELLAIHHEAAADYRAEHRLVVASADLHGVCAAVTRHSERYLRTKGPALGMQGLMAPLGLAAAIAVFVGYGIRLGFGGPTLPASLILAGVLYRVLRGRTTRQAAQNSWDADRERALADQWRRRRHALRGEPSDAFRQAEPPSRADDRLTGDTPPRR